MSEKTITMQDHIGIFDNYISKTNCNKVIEYFKKKAAFGEAYQRFQTEKVSLLEKNDTSVTVDTWVDDFKELFVNFDLALRRYVDNTGLKNFYSSFKIVPLKIQLTLPGQGYHTWHIEHGEPRDHANRVIVYTIYLNDVDEGGETEFLHQSVRVKPKSGRIVFWPAGYPYVHRGNPPLEGEKYIMTGWLNC
tara:strand:- start:286 stop:858 length:573 start_codon:yes stop_codon:yes gene_type:complete